MEVKVLFFAVLRDYVGARAIEMDIPEETTVAGLKELLMKRYPKLIPAKNSIMTAIDQEYVADEQVITQESEIALFPPVSGG